MERTMPKNKDYKDMVLDARPDRLDLRDREYRPHLRSLPPQFPNQKDIENFLPSYKKNGLILNQGKEGACTGFGLAATINYLIWRDEIDSQWVNEDFDIDTVDIKSRLVSERMLYHMARVYDEWEGEDYSGSSCRGAMKGWHRHGVCKKSLWEYDISGKFLPPIDDTWAKDALSEPLGAYYRVNHNSVVDMQAAITEVGAVYCSADVHEGWWVDPSSSLPIIKTKSKFIGGHAFCIIGYNEKGFVIQNSWGDAWGWNGFAVLQYADWVANGRDAWVVSRGVPVQATVAPKMFANSSLQDVATQRKDPSTASINKALKFNYPPNFKASPWSEDEAYCHSLVISNNGRPKHTVIAAENAEASANTICFKNVREWLKASSSHRKIMVYAHGGLNDEESSINRVRVMAPYFKANGVYPIFVIWKTGLGETLNNIISEAFREEIEKEPAQSIRVEGITDWLQDMGEFFKETSDRAIESIARGVHIKGLWSEMKENANFASDRAVPGFVQNRGGKSGAMVILASALKKLSTEFNGLQIHMTGHSAGSILLGEWLNEISKRGLSIKTVSLFAPACTIEFANKTFVKAVNNGVFKKRDLYIHNMDDEREQADNTGKVYQKSLLYLVSRALEDVHKMPLLGLQAAWDCNNCEEKKSGGFHISQKSEIKKWENFIKDGNEPKLYDKRKSQVKINTKPDFIDLSHGSFDNSIEVIEFTLKKILARDKLKVRVKNLCGY
jgi:hypothetical protein